MKNFVHLHVHTEYSLLDGACRISELPEAVKKHKQNAVAITDHGNMFGVVEFYISCLKAGVKPIIGCEVYVAKRTRFDKNHEQDGEIGHLVLLATDNEGYKNLIYLVSCAYTEGFYNKPRIDLDILRTHSRGLIALSACLSGFVQSYLLNNDLNGATDYINKMTDIMGEDNFFLEVQNHYLPDQMMVNQKLLFLSRQLGVQLVATNDVHYINKDDADAQTTLICIQTNRTLSEGKPFSFDTSKFYLKTGDEMAELFSDFDNAVENTVKIAERCKVDFDFSKMYLPEYKPANKMNSPDYLKVLSYEGFNRFIEKGVIAGNPIDGELYKKRLEFELDVIISMGYADYYLIVWDFINYAKSIFIPVGPGRGSGAGSLCAFFIGITNIDPIKYNLIFERFLNPERVSMPDFDIDLCQERRGEVIGYVKNKYGADKTAQIITFGTMAARGVVRDVGRVMGLSYIDVDIIAKMIPKDLGMTLDKALEQSKELKKQYESIPYVKNLIDMSRKLEGMPRHASTHAAGIVITGEPVYEYVPLAISSESVVTQFTMNTIAELGLLKIDFLGLRYLTIIENTIKEIKKKEKNFDIEMISLDDREIFAMFAIGSTDGVFQFESGGMKNLLTALKPEQFEDLIAAISLFRPGPMDSIPKYVQNRHNKDMLTYKIPELKEILDVTYGCIVYQEQVMQIFRQLAGYSFGQADIVRRAMSKKKAEVMNKEREVFLRGCVAHNIKEEYAAEVFDEMADFAKYAFNKSHAAAYSLISYRTAYLKRYYNKEFFAALLSSVLIDSSKLGEYVGECTKMGLKIYPPDINYSEANFTVTEDGIRYGMMAIKNVGLGFIKNIVNEREAHGLYSSFADFLHRIMEYDVNKRQIEALIKCGVFDTLKTYRSKLIAVYESLIDSLTNERKNKLPGQIDMFSYTDKESDDKSSEFSVDYPDIEEISLHEKLKFEKEAAGRFFSGHPLDEYSSFIKKYKILSVDYINKCFNDESENDETESDLNVNMGVILAGIITDMKIKQTKNNEDMAFLTFEDEFASIEVIVFPRVFRQFTDILKPDAVLALKGKISIDRDEKAKIILNDIITMQSDREIKAPEKRPDGVQNIPNSENKYNSKIVSEEIKPVKVESDVNKNKIVIVYLKIDSLENIKYEKIITLINIFSGHHDLKIYEENTKKIYFDKNKPVSLDKTFISELCRLLGSDNVKVIEK